MKIPVFDLGRAAARIESEVDAGWRALRQRTQFIGGDAVGRFESEFADHVGAPGCVGVANGTDALVLALRALYVGPGDEVIVPTFTFIATAAAVRLVGATPVFADVEEKSLNLDPASVAARFSPKTVGVIGVHLYGRPFRVDALEAVCAKAGVWLLEDAAQAHGATWQERPVGTFGVAATWSFYPSKNLGAFGDAGAVTSSDPEFVERVRRLANHGRTGHYEHAMVGSNSRLDALQAVVLSSRLARLDADNARRREIDGLYRDRLADLAAISFLETPVLASPVHHLLVVRAERRDELQRFLGERGIGSAVHYPVPLHRQPAFGGEDAEALEVAEQASREVLALPMFPELENAEVEEVCDAIRSFYG